MEIETIAPGAPKRPPTLPDPPPVGRAIEVAPGVRWIRMPLPFALDHINLWAIEDDDGWALVDTGIRHPDTIAAWESIFEQEFGGRPATRLLVTHQHADHAGLAGWITTRFACPLWMTRAEHGAARSLAARTGEIPTTDEHEFYERAGWQPGEIQALTARRASIARLYAPLPEACQRLHDGQQLKIGGRIWRVIAGGGHTPEHACFHCPELGLLISGDKILASISSNISVEAAEPNADPLGDWFETLAKLRRKVPDDTLVLPSHKLCFRGLYGRIDELVSDQRDALSRLLQALAMPRRVPDLFETLFTRRIDRSDISLFGLATGEAIALLNHLMAQGAVARRSVDGVDLYQEAIDANRIG